MGTELRTKALLKLSCWKITATDNSQVDFTLVPVCLDMLEEIGEVLLVQEKNGKLCFFAFRTL